MQLTDKIFAQIEDWRTKLLDLTKRNRLINCKIGPTAALELSHPSPQVIWDHLAIREAPLEFAWKANLFEGRALSDNEATLSSEADKADDAGEESSDRTKWSLEACLSSPRLKPAQLLTSLVDLKLATRLKRLALDAKTSIEEQGVNVLFAAFGMLQWYESKSSDVAQLSPLLLLPVTLNRAGMTDAWSLVTYENEIVENQCLRELLKANFKLDFPRFAVEEEEDASIDPFEYFSRVQKFLIEHGCDERWQITPKVLLGTFSFQKLAMWEDLGKNGNLVASHPVCRSIAGEPRDISFGGGGLPSPCEFDDRIPPTEVHSVLNSDSSQFEAILAAKRGTSLIVDGPPGTGKSQTIANMIAEFLAENKSVLFVSEKSAALEVVKRRLDEQRLGDFCLECHSHKANKKEVLAELKRSLDLPRERYRDQATDLQRLSETRLKLNEYVRAIHRPRGKLGINAFSAHGRLTSLRQAPPTRASLPDPLAATDTELRETEGLLKRMSRYDSVLAKYHTHAWRGSIPQEFSLTLKDDVRDTLQGLADTLDKLNVEIEPLVHLGLIEPRVKITELAPVIQRMRTLIGYSPLPAAWFEGDPHEIVRTIEELDAAERRLDQVHVELAVFRSTDGDITSPARNVLNSLRTDEYLKRINADGPGTVRQLRRDVEAMLPELRRLRASIVALRDGIEGFSRHLQIRIDANSSLGVLHKLTQIGTTIGESGPLKSAWFDAPMRAEVLRAEATCREDVQACKDTVEKFRHVWSNEAYGEEGEACAKEVLEYESFWQRCLAMFSGKWSAFYRKVRSLYVERPPAGIPSLMDDLKALRTYHRRAHVVRDLESKYKDQLLFDSSGNADWNALRRGVEAIDRLQALIKVPDKLKHILCSERLLNREALIESAHAIERQLAAIEGQIVGMTRGFSLQRIGERQRSYTDLSSSELENWLVGAESALGSLLVSLLEVESSLLPETDIPMADLPLTFSRLDGRKRQAAVVLQLRRRLGEMPATQGMVQNGRRLQQSDVDDARTLSKILTEYGARPVPAVVRVIADAEVRRQVSQAVTALTSIFRQKLQSYWQRFQRIFPVAKPVGSTDLVVDRMSIGDFAAWLRNLIERIDDLQEWVEFREIEHRLTERGLRDIVDEVLDKRLNSADMRNAFRRRFYRQWLDAAHASDPLLRNFQVDDHESLIESFRELDRELVDGAYKRIRSKLLEDPERPHSESLGAPPSSELGILQKEAARKRPRMPLRQLFRKIPRILRRLKPCMMMSPLAVSTFLDAPELQFDVVIFDEASQVRPYDAIGAIYRGKQLIVAGDQKQLPPTSFFDRMDTDEENPQDDEESTKINEFESILDVCCSLGMPRKRLRWHYRSRRESLIAFSNRFFYGNELVTFPSVFDIEGKSAVELHFVDQGRWISGTGGGFNPVEAKATAELVIRHFERTPKSTLGVITFNQRQQFAVLEELEKLRRVRPELAGCFSDSSEAPFFVKNLENVQGDERDHIILGVAYGFDAQNKFAMRFGPLNQQGGERRLNVAVTRARYATTVVSSIRAEHIDLNRTKSQGATLLRSFLDFAERGVAAIRAAVTETPDAEHDSEFEAEVERALTAKGLSVRRQIGCGGFRIDLAIVNPERPGRYLLGIECDGATYHSSATARDRDRLRQEILEGLGWTIHRIWSTDWIRHPEVQIERVLAAVDKQLLQDDDNPAVDPVPKRAEQTDEEQPTILKMRRTENGAKYAYDDIDDVPEGIICEIVLQSLQQYGKTMRDELVKSASKQLGFQRTGRKIQQKIEGVIDQLAGQGRVSRNGEGEVCVS